MKSEIAKAEVNGTIIEIYKLDTQYIVHSYKTATNPEGGTVYYNGRSYFTAFDMYTDIIIYTLKPLKYGKNI